MNNKLVKLAVVLLGLASAQWAHATDWSADEYNLYPGDFNGDGKQDLLYVAKDPAKISGIALSDGTAPNTPWQTWPSNYLGIPWSGNQYTAIVADFNGDGKADILMQRATAGDSYLLLADSGGKIVAISQTIASSALGLNWSADQHKLLAGDINNDGKADLFFQATGTSGTHAVVYADAGGTFTIAPTQTWSDSYLGLNWSTQTANVFLGDFNGDRRIDLLVQAKPKFVMIDYDITFPVPTYPPNMNGIVYSIGGASPYQLANLQTWSRMNNGVDWSPLTNSLLVGDFNGDGRADVLFQAKYASGTHSILNGNATGAAFPATATAITTSTVPLSSDSNQVIVGNFDGGAATGIYIQALTAGGTNYTANSVGGTVTATTHNPNTATGTVPATAVGHTTGSFAVSNMGAATYSIPIVVPPGVANMQPQLAISYQSGGGNGYLGVGWSLNGFSEIERCKQTIAQDGTNAGITLTASDKFCLDGNRLRLTSGTYGATGSTYQTEVETFSRVTANGAAGTGSAWFKVETKSGLIYEYGNTADSRIESTNPNYTTTARVWLLNKVSDRAGNTMTVSYIEDGAPNGSFRPNEILYTSNANAGLAANYKVKFFWEARSTSDILSAYFAGGLAKETNRLNHIETQYNDPAVGAWRLVRKYQLSYNNSGNTTRTLLGSIQECEQSGTCLAPTTISWQSGTSGWLAETSSGSDPSALMKYSLPVDIDGDGRTDLVYPQPVSGTTYWFYMKANVLGGFDTPVNTNINAGDSTNLQYAYAYPGSYLGNGLTAILVNLPGYSTRQLLSWNGTTLIRVSTNISASFSGTQWVGDVDGDGMTDFVYAVASGSTATFYHQRNTGLINGAVSFSAPQGTYTASLSGVGLYNPLNNNYHVNASMVDINGDGRMDIIIPVSHIVTTGANLTIYSTIYSNGAGFVSNGGGLAAPGTIVCALCDYRAPALVGDFNGDGLSDILIAAVGSVSWDAVYYGSGTGGFGGSTNIVFGSNLQQSPAQFIADYDGDGRQDIFYALQDSNGNGVGNWMVLRSNGTGFDAAVDTGIPAVSDLATVRPLDVNGDGAIDIGYQNSQFKFRNHAGVNADLVAAITDGFGNSVGVTYAPLTDSSVYIKGNTATFPEMDMQLPMPVVKQYTSTTGVADPASSAGTYTVTEKYAGLRIHAQGRGVLGFASRIETDSRTGNIGTTVFNQSYPYTGTVYTATVKQPNGKTISYATNGYADMAAGTVNNDRHYPYLSSSTQISYEVNPNNTIVDGQMIGKVTKTISAPDSYGNSATTTAVNYDMTSGSAVTAGTIVSTQTFFNDATNWCLGYISQSQLQSTPAGQAAQTRTTQFVKDSNALACRTYQQIVEPGNSALTVTTTYGYDAFGHVNNQTVSAADITSRVTTTNYGSQGVFSLSVTNAAGESASKTYDYALGVPLSATDSNNISITWQYDGFGRKTRESRPDGSATKWTLFSCSQGNFYCGDNLLRYQIVEQQLDSGGGEIRKGIVMYDALARPVYAMAQTLSGATSVVRTVYNPRGQVDKRSLPYFSGFGTNYTSYMYDLANRVIEENRPISDTNSATQSSKYSFEGLLNRFTDANGKITTKYANALGQVVRVTDPAGGNTYYTYDPFGNLLTTQDPLGNTITNTFNIRGMKLTTSDPDMGNWTYAYYSTGELKTQTDAKNQTVNFTYDTVGRPKQRVEPEGTTTWNYGVTVANRDVGKLISVSSPGSYAENYTFDSLGRPQDATTVIDGNSYVTSNSYHPVTGLLDTVTYPASTTAVPNSRFKVQYDYTNGLLKSVKDYNTPSTVYWQQIATNAAGQTIDEQVGNGLHTYTTYDNTNGRLTDRTTGATSQVQNLHYQWDLVGNLTRRNDQNLGTTEQFYYADGLYRLDHSTLTSGGTATTNLSLTYDASGNITTKSDVGAYDYSTVQAGCTYYTNSQPHAVRKAGTNVYCYDANGNMVKRNADVHTWTSYNLPSKLFQGSNYAQFSYGASRQRYKQVAFTATGGNLPPGTETTLYVGGLFEKVTKPSGVAEYKHTIMAGKEPIAIKTLRSNGINDTRYLHKDHLGSVDVITDEFANVVLRESFDAFGKRRSATTWTAAPSSGDWTTIAATTHRGYTFHEQLDNVSLVHMNGRVYDPQIGRFLSADPTIQAPFMSQSLNRYSYVMNNPLSMIDPSGFSWLSKAFRSIGSFLKKWGGTILGIVLMFIPGVNIIAFALIMGTYNSLVNGGNFLQNVVVAGISAAVGQAMGGLTSGWGSSFGAMVARGAMVGGVVGGVTSVMMGGSFAEGFKSGAIAGGIIGGLAWGVGGNLFARRGPQYASNDLDELLITATSKSSKFDVWFYKFYERWNAVAAASGTGLTYHEMKQQIANSPLLSDGQKAGAFNSLHDQLVQMDESLRGMSRAEIKGLMDGAGDSGDPTTWKIQRDLELLRDIEDSYAMAVTYDGKAGAGLMKGAMRAIQDGALRRYGSALDELRKGLGGVATATENYDYEFRFCGGSWCR